jgi:methionyl-tRNA synthetase
MTAKVLITSALPYANGPLHFGHIAGAYLPADCYARYERLQGKDVLYVCGSDEYGVAITMSAEQAGRSPQEHVDLFHKVNSQFFQQLNFSFDHFSRTTCAQHEAPVLQFFNDLHANGHIETRVTDQLYSEEDGKFLADRYVVGSCPKCKHEKARGDECPRCGASYDATDLINPRSKLSNAPLTLKPTEHCFLLLDRFKESLLEWLSTKQWKPNVTNFVKDYIENLHPRAITRDSKWGIPVPLDGFADKVLYVWFDAPIGYISASQEWAELQGTPDRWKDYWCDPETKLVHFVGKDNIPFHGVIFPAMVMGQNQPFKLVDELPANEFLNLEGRQFSKSDGWYIDLEDFFKNYTADQIRYALAANAPESSDSEFTWKDFQMRMNSELVGKYGNFINRTLVFAKKFCDSRIPAKQDLEEIDLQFLAEIKRLSEEVSKAYAGFHLRKASQIVMEIAQVGNGYFDAKQPWKDAKAPETEDRMKRTIASCLDCAKLMALTAHPIMPQATQRIWGLLGLEGSLEDHNWDAVVQMQLPVGQILAAPEILFNRVDDEAIDVELAKLEDLKSKA